MVYEGSMRKRKNAPPSKGAVRFSVCAWLLFAAFICRFMFRDSTDRFFMKANEVIGGSVDYEAAISTIGMAVSGEKPIGAAVKDAFIYAFVVDSNRIETFSPQETDAGSEPQRDTEPDIFIPSNVSMESAELNIDHVAPVSGAVLRPFGYYLSGTMEPEFNYGCDLKTGAGAEVVSFSDGHVYAVGTSTIYGEYVIILHEGAKTLYSDLSDICVSSGTDVIMGQSIGKTAGDTLHFELMVGGLYVNPEFYLEYEG